MVEPVIKTPWNSRMTPEEMEEYYEQKLEQQKRECERDDCNETVKFPREYCSDQCRNYAVRKAHAKLFDEPEPIKPENVPRRTPEDMQRCIDELRERFKD